VSTGGGAGHDADALARALPGYDIGQELGRGSFGVVYAGWHRHLGRPVAIKLLSRALSDDVVHTRFLAEARVLASLHHPHIVPVYDYVEYEGRCLLVMEHLDGGTVWEQFQRQGISPEQACAIGIITAAALHHAHGQGILHRDIKPGNLLFAAGQHAKLTDFGIAKVVGGVDALTTSAGEVLGTPAYIAPEQASGAGLSPAADVYAAAVMLYELLSGQLPYSEEGGALAIVFRHVHEDPQPLNSMVSPAIEPLANVVMRALARKPTERFATAEDFGVALCQAAVASFGPGWLARTDLALFAGGRIGEELGRSPLPVVLNQPARASVRPTVGTHVAGAAPSVLDDPLLAVRELLETPPPPRRLALLSLALCAVLALVACVGVGSPPHDGTLPARSITVAGQPTTREPVRVDVGAPVAIEVPGGTGVSSARVTLSVVGVTLAGSRPAALTPKIRTASPGAPSATTVTGSIVLTSALSSPRYLVPGPVTATVEILGASGHVLGSEQFTASPTGGGFVTAPGIVVIVLALFVTAYLESLLRPLRRLGRWQRARGVAIGIVGAVGGVTVVALAWVTGLREPTMLTVAAGVLLGASATVVAAVALTRYGLRARARRVAANYERFVLQAHAPSVFGASW
jgi:hypothetical protein